MWTRGRPHFP